MGPSLNAMPFLLEACVMRQNRAVYEQTASLAPASAARVPVKIWQVFLLSAFVDLKAILSAVVDVLAEYVARQCGGRRAGKASSI
jgi:hypothetical protein